MSPLLSAAPRQRRAFYSCWFVLHDQFQPRAATLPARRPSRTRWLLATIDALSADVLSRLAGEIAHGGRSSVGQSARLWLWRSGVRAPSLTPRTLFAVASF